MNPSGSCASSLLLALSPRLIQRTFGSSRHFLSRALALRGPASLVVATLFDRPYRRLVDDLPIRYVGFTIPDEFFVGYGFALNERGRNLPDLHLVE